MFEKKSMDLLGRMSAEDFKKSDKIPVVLILENIRSGLNVGSLFRTADAFLLKGIFCVGYTPTPPHREVLKSALGATETVEWEQVTDTVALIDRLKSQGFKCFAVEQTEKSIALNEFQLPPNPTAYILGNEVHGVEQQTINACDGVIEIAQHGTKHSLNVAVCGGIVLYSVFNSIKQTH